MRYPQDETRMNEFKEVLEECNLMDVGYRGAWFTWEWGNLPKIKIHERLDKGLLMIVRCVFFQVIVCNISLILCLITARCWL